MDCVPINGILQLRPDTFEEILKEYNLDKPGRMKEAVQLLDDWVQKQPHFRKKDFDPHYLETTIIGCKGSLERAKTQLDKICTFRTLMPIFFGNVNAKTDFVHLHKVVQTALLPKLTPDHYRVIMTKYNNVTFGTPQIYDYLKKNILLAEYLKTHDYFKGFILISDFSEVNVTDFVTRVNPMILREAFKIFFEGYGMRIKSINIISSSKFVDALVSILKQVATQKIGERITVHKTIQDTYYLETTILGGKGSLERAKTQLDKICTMRTLLPMFFGNYNVKTDFGNLHTWLHTAPLPTLTPDHYRVHMTKFNNVIFETSRIDDFYKYLIILAEYLKTHDYFKGFLLIADFSEANIMDIVTRINPMLLREAFRICIEGYGMRIKSINIISASKYIDAFVSILKQVLSQKLGERIQVHKRLEDIHKVLPKEILPREYGGEEKSLKKLSDECVEILSSKEHMDRIANMNNACTDESCRPQHIFSEQYAGMPGSFRLLSVD